MKIAIGLLTLGLVAMTVGAPMVNAGPNGPNECDDEMVMVNCLYYERYCSPNNPPEYPGPNCENGIWMTYITGICTLYVRPNCYLVL